MSTLVRDEPEPTTNARQEVANPIDYVPDHWTGPPNGRPSEDLSAPIIEPIINAHTILTENTYQPPSSIDIILAGCEKSQGYMEDDYLPLDAISPSHLATR